MDIPGYEYVEHDSCSHRDSRQLAHLHNARFIHDFTLEDSMHPPQFHHGYVHVLYIDSIILCIDC